jgi:DNA helicase-2/ATP-dependent DNA helicase PcrA
MAQESFNLPIEIKQQFAQTEAIMHGKGPLMIIAGPGSGKTKVLVWRTIKLLIQDKVDPENIWLTTFTEKAAKQLRAEIASIMKDLDSKIQVSKILVGTLHATCLKLIQTFPDVFKDVRNPPEILDDNKQLIFLLSNYRYLKIDRVCDSPGQKPDIGKIYEVLDQINWLTEFGVDPDLYAKKVNELFRLGDSRVKEHDIWMTKTYKAYLNLVSNKGLLDFGQIQRKLASAINDYDLDQKIAEKIKYILVDEYQDVNPLQQYILSKIAKQTPEANITVVGDDDQAIYQFRGAGVGTLRDFQETFAPKKIELTTNFRSSQSVVDASSALVSIGGSPYRFEKKLQSNNLRKKEHLKVLKIHSEILNDSACKTVEFLQELVRNGKIRNWGDIVILLRSIKPNHILPYVSILDEKKIPYTVLGRTGLFSTPQGMGILLYFDYLTNTTSFFSQEFLQCSLLGFKDESIEAILSLGNSPTNSQIDQLTIDSRDKILLQSLIDVHAKNLGNKNNALRAIYDILQVSGYLNSIARDDNAIKIVSKITSLAHEFSEMYSPRILPFANYIKGLWEAGRAELPESTVTDPLNLKIMTIHQAKGLEFPVVVIGEAVEGRFPCRSQADSYYKPKELAQWPSKEETHEDEERRLFYVAMTRSRDLLIINSADKISKEHKRCSGETRWLKNLPTNVLGSLKGTSNEIKRGLGWDFEFKKERETYSFSKLNYYRFCPFRYKMVRDIKFAFPTKVYFVIGKNMHESLQKIHNSAIKGLMTNQNDLKEIIDKSWKDIGNEQINTKIKHSVERYLIRYIAVFSEIIKSSYAAEKEFWVFFDEGLLTGRIDLIVRDTQNEFKIMDFKIGKVPGFEYNEQLKTYLLGAKLGLNLKINKAAIYVLKPDRSGKFEQPQEYSFSDDEIEESKHSILNTIHEIETGNFQATPSKEKCKKCELTEYALCPYAL